MRLNSKLNGMDYETVVHRLEYSVIYRLKDKKKMENAIKIQDSIRKKTKGGINLTKEIRKWRETRCF